MYASKAVIVLGGPRKWPSDFNGMPYFTGEADTFSTESDFFVISLNLNGQFRSEILLCDLVFKPQQ